MRKFAICFLCLAIIFSLMAFPASAEEDKNSLYSGVDATSAIIEKQVVTNATSAIVYELNSNTMLVSQNIDERMYPASLVKVMTAYIAIEMGNLDTLVTVTLEAPKNFKNVFTGEIFENNQSITLDLEEGT